MFISFKKVTTLSKLDQKTIQTSGLAYAMSCQMRYVLPMSIFFHFTKSSQDFNPMIAALYHFNLSKMEHTLLIRIAF